MLKPTFKIEYNKKDITKDVSNYVVNIEYTDFEHGQSDEISITFEDSEKLWQNAWIPSKGDSLRLFIGYEGEKLLNCGVFEIDEIEFATPPDTLIVMEKQSNNKFQPIITTALPVYTNKLQKHSDINSVPTMISDITTAEFRKGYVSTASSTYNGSYIPACAFNHNLATKWMASIVGGNQWLQIDFPNPRIAARFGITASADTPTGCIYNGYIKGFDGEKWIVLLEIPAQAAWGANEVRYFDAVNFTPCSKYKPEMVNIMNGATYAQIAQFEVFELAYCYVVPENTFYKYNPATGKYEAKEVNFIGRIKTQHNFVSDVNSYAQEGVYISDETNIWASSTFAFSHNLGFDYKNMRISTWIKDKTNGFIMPWEIDSILDYSHEWNNNGFYYDDCLFYVRTGTGLMQYKDYGGTNRSITSNCSLIIQLERNF